MLEWDDLRHFLAIARHGTLSGAARALGVQQSTMGRRLDAIEQRTGAKLLHKTPGGFILTPAGETILDSVVRIESEALAIERAITGQDVRLEGVIRVTVVEALAVEVMTPILAAFQEKYPGITLDLLTDARLFSLTKGEADVALRLSAFTQNDVVVRKLAELAIGVYASPTYLARHDHPDFARGAPGHRVLCETEDRLATSSWEWFAGYIREAAVAMRSNSYYMLAAAAEAGMGIAALPRFLGDAAALERLETPQPPPVRTLWLGVHRDLRQTPRIRALTDFLAVQLKQTPLLNPAA